MVERLSKSKDLGEKLNSDIQDIKSIEEIKKLELKLCHLIHFYEFVEECNFPFTLRHVKPAFCVKSQDSKDLEAQISILVYECKENESMPDPDSVKLALQRMISRRLIVDMDPDKKIAEFIVDDSLWSDENAEKAQNLAFPMGLTLKNAIQVYEILKEKIKEIIH